MKIILINPPDDLRVILGEGVELLPSFEPLGLLYIAGVCLEAGFDVQVIDAYAEGFSENALRSTISHLKPDVVGMTTLTSNGGVVLRTGQWIKKSFPEMLVALGNIHASVFAEAYLRNKACDVVVHGEGEWVFLNLLQARKMGKKDFSDIPSVSFLREGTFFTVPGSGVVEDLGKLPLPARSLVKQPLYNIPPVSNIPFPGKKGSIGKHLFTSRGCPRNCSFCVVHKNQNVRFNPPEKVVQEIESLHKDHGANYIFFMDSLFVSRKERVIELCSRLKQRNLDIRWGCEAHVDFIDRELIEAMEQGGCHDIAIGIESGVQRLLDGVSKGTTLQQIERAVKMVKRNSRIKVSGLFILGLPGETYRDSLQTMEFSKRLPLDMAQFSLLVPYPGSRLFEKLRKNGELDTGIGTDWSIDTSAWERYSGYLSYTNKKPIWTTPALDPDTLKKLQKQALREFYFRPRQILFQLRRLRFEDTFRMAKAFWKTFF